MNLEDIARMAGVSRSTVSRVVNKDSRVSDEVRRRVLAIIEEANYQPNAAARSLAKGRTGIIGLLIPQEVATIFVDSWFARLIQGCLRACSDRDLSFMLMMEPSYDPGAVERVIQRTIRAHHIDGLIIASSFENDVLLDRLQQEKFPYMMIGRDVRKIANFVDVDNFGATRHATLHLLQHGGRKPAMVAGPRDMVAANDRVSGFRDAVASLGINPDTCPIRHADWSQKAAYQVTLELLNSPDPPDAFFSANDSMAIGVMQAIRSKGRRVPEDIQVVGFDDIEIDRTAQMGLTTIEQPIDQVASAAVDLLQQQLERHPAAPLQWLLPTRLIIRSSCGCNRPGVFTLPAESRVAAL